MTVITDCKSLYDLVHASTVANNSRDREVALLAARAWLDETARRAMVLNRHQDYRELQFWARNELAAFNDYCVRLPGGRDLSDKMSRLFARVMRPMQERNRKEVSLSVLKSQRSIADYRETAMADADFDAYLDDGK